MVRCVRCVLESKDPNILERNPNNHMRPMSKDFVTVGRKNFLFNRKKHPSEPGSGRAVHLPWPVGCEGR